MLFIKQGHVCCHVEPISMCHNSLLQPFWIKNTATKLVIIAFYFQLIHSHSPHSCRVWVLVPSWSQSIASPQPQILVGITALESSDCSYSNFKIKNFVQLTVCPSFMPAMFQTNVVLASLYGTLGIHTGLTLRWNTASKVYRKQICADIVCFFISKLKLFAKLDIQSCLCWLNYCVYEKKMCSSKCNKEIYI